MGNKDSDTYNFIHTLDQVNDYRYERKFIVPDHHSVKELEHQLKSNSRLFSEIFHQRQVNNIYFDSRDYSNYHDNVIGLANRKKFRIRWYGDAFGRIENPKLEVKIKKGLIGDKWTFDMKSFTLNNEFSAEYIQGVFNDSNLPLSIHEELKMSIPTLLNTYQRKYFLSFDQRFRITLDFDLRYHNMEVRRNNFNKIPLKDPNKIIEMKYQREDDDDAKKITSQFSFRLHKNSKYVNGIYALKHIPQ